MCPWLTPTVVHWVYLSDFTSPGVSVTIGALDVGPCTDETTDCIVWKALLKAGDARGEWIWKADSTILSNYTREYHITTNTGSVTTKNKTLASQYVQPVIEWIFLELTVLELEPPPLYFTRFVGLANGIC